MSDTCIVCLGDLSIGNSESPAVTAVSVSLAKSPGQDGATLSPKNDPSFTAQANINHNETGLIAHLQPCGHDLHNQCLIPWVERTNSCPICRQSFHLVEISHIVGGDIISSYPVEDRTQVADLDPSMFLEVPDEEDEDQPCQACGEDDNEDVLMYCDGCQKLWHTYCVGLQEVPYGAWFCDHCRAHREVDPRQTYLPHAQRPLRRRTRGQQRRQRTQQNVHDTGWSQLWQSVWERISLDLDFPFDDDDSSATVIRRHRQRNSNNRQAHDAWRRRMQVAELQGAGGRFREIEPALLNPPPTHLPRRRPSPATEVQTADEAMAWLAFDQARAADTDNKSSLRKKRKSASASPSEREESGVELIKRRRTSQPETSRMATAEETAPGASPIPRRPSPLSRPSMLSLDTGAPSFLQSLLQEVEESSHSSHNIPIFRPQPRNATSPSADGQSPRPSSPALSPLPSNHSSPRALSATPPPLSAPRPSSPTGLSSTILPVFPPTDFSTPRASSEPRDDSSDSPPEARGLRSRKRKRPAETILLTQNQKPRTRVPPHLASRTDRPTPISRPRSAETSPTRANMSLSSKENVQKLVAAALKPHYNDHTITKDEYIEINKSTSRTLYDQIGNDLELVVEITDDQQHNQAKSRWEKVAKEMVEAAINALTSSKGKPDPPKDSAGELDSDIHLNHVDHTPKEILVNVS